jgi:hypothetical protein
MAIRILLLIPATNNSEVRHIQRKFLGVPFSGKSVKQFLTSEAQFSRNMTCLSLLIEQEIYFHDRDCISSGLCHSVVAS